MLAVVHSSTILGIDAAYVQVEVDISSGLPGFATVGLPESSVREARVRVQAAIQNSGYLFPAGKITVNLAPASLKKDGTGFDFPIALGILAACGIIPVDKIKDVFAMGELSLTGKVRPVRGVLAAAEIAAKKGFKRMLVAPENGGEAALLAELQVHTVKNFQDAVEFLLSEDDQHAPIAQASDDIFSNDAKLDLADVRGQHHARRALEISAAGGHNLLFVGGPGSGKTMMASRMPSILPPMSRPEALEVTRIHSAAGLNVGGGLVSKRPFREPHHSTTRAGLVGGGNNIPRPGELSLATHGVLFLDELPEFSRHVLEVLRQPLETGEVVLSRANATVKYPAKIMLVAAMNPCPCGNFGVRKKVCRCSAHDIMRYKSKLSGPLLDRIDLHVEVPPVELCDLQSKTNGEDSKSVLQRVINARKIQQDRSGDKFTNAKMTKAMLNECAYPTADGRALLAAAMERLGMSARAYDRVLRVARTIADLNGDNKVDAPHLSEAIQYREDERSLLAA